MNIYLDIGHGGTDTTGTDTGTSGTLNSKTYKENDCNLAIGLTVKKILEGSGHMVDASRTGSTNLGGLVGNYGRADSNLINSAAKCKNGDYDFMVSIHNNGSNNATARGFQIFWKTGDGKAEDSETLAKKISEQLVSAVPENCTKESTKGASGKDYYGILRLHDKVGCLIECAFMTNPEDIKILSESSNLLKIGNAIAEGILNYISYKTPPNDDTDYKEAYKQLSENYGILEQQYNDAVANINKLKSAQAELEKRVAKLQAGDVNEDGKVSFADAKIILNKLD